MNLCPNSRLAAHPAIRIGRSRLESAGTQVRLTAELTVNGHTGSVYFGVDRSCASGLAVGRADPFLALMLNFALRTGQDILCEDPVSERLLYGLRHLYIPVLSSRAEEFSAVRIEAEPASRPMASQNAVGAAMSFGCDSLHTFFRHREDPEYPITHLCNFNNGVYHDAESCRDHTARVAAYAAEHGLQDLFVDSNIQDVSPERFLDVYTQRNLACVLAVQGLFGTYLYSAGHPEAPVAIDPRNAAHYDPVTIEAFRTESLQFFLSGCETDRVEKLRFLCGFEDARHHLHPCFKAPIGSRNCGHCRKDIREMVLFYAWGVQEKFADVYDWTGFEQRLPCALGILLALSSDPLYGDVIREYRKCGGTIPPQSYAFAAAFRKSLAPELPESPVFPPVQS